jgi:hypothetical protein
VAAIDLRAIKPTPSRRAGRIGGAWVQIDYGMKQIDYGMKQT